MSILPPIVDINIIPKAKSQVKVTPIEASDCTRPLLCRYSIRNELNKPTLPAPISTGKPVLDPVSRNADTIPGKTAWEIASLSIDILRSTKKVPANAQAIAVIDPVNIIQKASIL
jgi:hypothetical protein